MTREQLTAIRNDTRTTGIYQADSRYIDWSSVTDDGGRTFEVGDEAAGMQVDLSPADLAALVGALADTLDRDALTALVHRLATTLLADQ
jgi:hypothetical protein